MADRSLLVQKTDAIQAMADHRGPGPTQRIHDIARAGVQGSGGRLPYLDRIQASFGRHDIRHVQAFTGATAATASRAIGASAYTTGDRIAFAETPSLHTAAHEAAHTIQQRAGVQLYGGVGSVGDRYERQADAVADAVVKGRSAEPLLDAMSPASACAPAGAGRVAPVQRKLLELGYWNDDPNNTTFEKLRPKLAPTVAEREVILLHALDSADEEYIVALSEAGKVTAEEAQSVTAGLDLDNYRVLQGRWWTFMLPDTIDWEHIRNGLGQAVVTLLSIPDERWLVRMDLDLLPHITANVRNQLHAAAVAARTPSATMLYNTGLAYEQRIGTQGDLKEFGVLGNVVISVTPRPSPLAGNKAKRVKTWIMQQFHAWEPMQKDPRHMGTHDGYDPGVGIHYHLVMPPGAQLSVANKIAIAQRIQHEQLA